VADAFDAMTHARPYKAAFSVEHAVAEIKRCSGTQFDPQVVEAFMTLRHYDLVEADCRSGR
jgi:HD-GYP domain-containing protein (c-di-GMP phosphodiesterase class II)